MKILRKNNDFKKVKDKSVEDILAIKNLINQGWVYCPKQIYKDLYRDNKPNKKD
jgi:hypothetical protein